MKKRVGLRLLMIKLDIIASKPRLVEKDIEISRKNIVLAEAIREFGSFNVTVQLNRGVKAQLPVVVQQK